MAQGQLRIDALYAYVALDPEDNTEGVIGFEGTHPVTGGSMMVPGVGADMERMLSLLPQAQEIAQVSGTKVTLMKFSNREEVRVLPGKGQG